MNCPVAQTVSELIEVLKAYPPNTPIVASCDEEGNSFSLGVSIGYGTAGSMGVSMSKKGKIVVIYPYEHLPDAY